jgi:hypothetical protein
VRELTAAQAKRREWTAGLAAFVLAAVTTAAVALYAVRTYIFPEKGWLDAIVTAFQLLFYSALSSAGIALFVMRMLERHHYASGAYRCYRCNRPLRDRGSECVCFPKERRVIHRPPRHWMRHSRKRIVSVLLTYAALVPVTLCLARLSPRPPTGLSRLAFCHALLCVLAAAAIHLVQIVCESLHAAPRFRVRAPVFIRVLMVWPLLVLCVGMVCHLIGLDLLAR